MTGQHAQTNKTTWRTRANALPLTRTRITKRITRIIKGK